MGDAIVDAVRELVLAACFLRYADALKLGDNYASETSRAACWSVALYVAPVDEERMWKQWGVENPAGPEELAIDDNATHHGST